MSSTSGWRRVAAATLVLVALVSVGAVLRARDVRAERRLAAACMRIRAQREGLFESVEPVMSRMFEEDAEFMREVVLEVGEEPCVEVGARLSDPFPIGALEAWQATPWPAERMDRLRTATERARQRCPPIMDELLAPVLALGDDPSSAARMRETCDQMFQSLETFALRDAETVQPLGLYDWVDNLDALATALETREPAGE